MSDCESLFVPDFLEVKLWAVGLLCLSLTAGLFGGLTNEKLISFLP